MAAPCGCHHRRPLSLSIPNQCEATMNVQPNIVWICADDFTPDACGAYGSTKGATPRLDQLAAEGLLFDRAFCNCPLSTPARQAFWTGRYPRSIGVTLSPMPLPEEEVTLPELLHDSGYHTAAFGKTHFYCPRSRGLDLHLDFLDYQQLGGPEPIPPDIPALGPWMPFYDPADVWLNSRCLPYAARDQDMFGTYLATHASQWLQEQSREPFFLYVSFHETHSPFRFPIEYRDRYKPDQFEVPEVTLADRLALPQVFQSLTPEQKKGILAAYHTCSSFMDKNVGLVLDALDQSGHRDDTIVIFTSDHGYLLGQHGRFEKHCCFDPGIRVALMLRYPTLIASGQKCSAFVELIDLLPTLLEQCGIPVPENIQGRSLSGLLNGNSSSHRDAILVEYADNAEAAIRTERWKLIYSAGNRHRGDGYARSHSLPGPRTMLFDLIDDPEEQQDLSGEPEHQELIEELLQRLVHHLQATAREPLAIPDGGSTEELLAALLLP